MRAVSRALLVTLALVATASPALADDVARSKALYKKGENAFAMGDYAHAAEYFEQSYSLSQRPQLLWNVAAAHRAWFDLDHDAAHLRRARSVYANYASLIDVPREREEAQREIARLDEQIAALEKEPAAPPATAPSPSRSPSPPAPRESPLAAPPAPAVESPPSEALSPLPAVPQAAASERDGATPVYKRWWLWTLVGVVVAGGAATGLVLGLRGDTAPPDGLNAGVVKPTFP